MRAAVSMAMASDDAVDVKERRLVLRAVRRIFNSTVRRNTRQKEFSAACGGGHVEISVQRRSNFSRQ